MNGTATVTSPAHASFWVPHRVLPVMIGTLLAVIIICLKFYNVFWFWYNPILHVYSLTVTGYIIARIVLSLYYREPEDRNYFPSVSIVIAVKNEKAHIIETIERCLSSRYPRELMEAIVVDDGSTDGTWEALEEFQKKQPSVRLFRFAENKGKRHAMALGAEQGKGEVLIYVDSDSLLAPEGIYKIVQPFSDVSVGAVAGHVQVVITDNVISKMESVRYFVSHKVMKAAEPIFGAVTCCSGAFSAYRRSAVMEILPAWLNQRFLGTTTTFGDDRSLTNFILKKHRVLFHNSARCYTYVPETWSKYFRQQLRWKKSWTRETLVASKIMYRKHPAAAITYYVGVILTLLAPLMVIRNMIWMPIASSQSFLPYLIGLALVYLLFCCIFFYYTQARHWYYGLVFALLYIGVLSWQNYYAMATVRRTHWGTR